MTAIDRMAEKLGEAAQRAHRVRMAGVGTEGRGEPRTTRGAANATRSPDSGYTALRYLRRSIDQDYRLKVGLGETLSEHDSVEEAAETLVADGGIGSQRVAKLTEHGVRPLSHAEAFVVNGILTRELAEAME